MDLEDQFFFDGQEVDLLREKDEKEFMLPWMKYQYLGDGWEERKKEGDKKFLQNVSGLSKKAEMFFRYQNDGDYKSADFYCDGDILDYLDYKFFHKEFGITPVDLLSYDAEWVEKMVKVNNANNHIRMENINGQRKEEEAIQSEERANGSEPLYANC